MAKGKAGGFLTALILAVVSFLIIFFFFTDVSDKYFGVSYKGDAKELVDSAVKSVDSEKVTEIVTNAASKAKEAVSDISSLIGTPEGKK